MRGWGRVVSFALVNTLMILGLAWLVGHSSTHPAWPSTSMLAATLCMTINFLAWIPASVWRTERYYDLTGALTCLCMMAAVLYVERGTVGFRGGLVALCVCIWAVRLGRFLFRRIVRDGGVDRRFDGLREHPDRFLIPWTLQGMWVTLNTLAAVVIISNHDASQALGLADAIGFGLWGVGFAIEVIADRQKTVFRADPANHDAFITTGLWARSRHPNYFGEIMLWSGVFIVGTPHYVGWQWLVVISPLFCAFLLTRVSGIPMVETRSNARWGHLEAYQAYLAKTPVLIPRLWP